MNNQTWTQQADEVLQLMEQASAPQNDSERKLRVAVLNLCRRLKDEDRDNRFVPEPLF
jgi:hypothetical protein